MNKKTIQFTLLSPTSSKTMDINWLEIQTLEGNFVIKPGHAPLIVVAAPNKELTIELSDGSVTMMSIAGGILEVNRTTALLLLTHE